MNISCKEGIVLRVNGTVATVRGLRSRHSHLMGFSELRHASEPSAVNEFFAKVCEAAIKDIRGTGKGEG